MPFKDKEKQRASARKHARKKYHDNKERHICVYCGCSNPSENQKVFCSEHTAWHNLQRKQDPHLEVKYATYRLKTRYGITKEQKIALLELQEYCCAGCWEPLGVGKTDVDHDHKTGIIRGIMHPNCNRALGLVNDESQKLRRLADYLDNQNMESFILGGRV